MKKTIYIKDYVSLPCNDASKGIKLAIEDAKKTGANCLQFEAGVYPLKSFTAYKTDQTAHDAGASLLETKDVFILLDDLQDITISGVLGENGEPLTVLEGDNDKQLHSILPSILWLDKGKNITIQNFKFKRNPEFCSAGKVIKKTTDTITIEVFEGNPCYDNMGTHCMNKFTPDGQLNGESLSYGPGLKENFKLIDKNILSLKDEGVANRVEIGDIITFHQGGKTDFQCFFGNIENLTLKNLHTSNSNGFAHLGFNINNLTIENVKFKPENNQYFTAPRDAFKLHKCSGEINVRNMYIEGVRMDGQNMHSNYLFPIEFIDANTVKFFTRYAYLDLKNGTDIEFYFKEEVKLATIKDWQCNGQTFYANNHGYFYTVTFENDVPDGADCDTLCLARCWEPSLYVCKNSTFMNIAGAGHLSRIDHMRISDCKYKNLMNSGILLGAEFPTHTEGGHATDIKISGCEFENCGNTARYDARGCIGIKSHGIDGKNNQEIYIENCKFKNSDIGVDIHDAKNVFIKGCEFDGVEKEVCIDKDSTSDIYFE